MSDLELAVSELIDDRLLDVHTCFPARVVSYDASKQAARLRAGSWTDGFPIDDLIDVPVVHPRGGAGFVHLPLQAGDWVLVLCAETALSRWKQQRTEGAEPDPQRHSLNGALALPLGGIDPIANLSTSAVTVLGGEIRLGPANPTHHAARAEDVLTELQRIKSDLDALKVALLAHGHSGVMTGPGVSGPPAALAWSPSSPSSVASDVVKLD
jgi:Phage protein Gp138 N-terminal domain